ncbi:MAG: hypothetical protein ACM3XM_06980 [Mycobacterium leprae]
MDATPALAVAAGRIYWAFLDRYPGLRVAVSADGSVAIRLLGILLLAFRPPAVLPLGDGWGLRYPISHGAVVDPRHRGEGHLQMGVEPAQVSRVVEGFYPSLVRIGRRFYEGTQAVVHLYVAKGYLPRLAALVDEKRAAP